MSESIKQQSSKKSKRPTNFLRKNSRVNKSVKKSKIFQTEKFRTKKKNHKFLRKKFHGQISGINYSKEKNLDKKFPGLFLPPNFCS